MLSGCATPFEPVATSATVLVPDGVCPAGADDVPGVSAPGTIVPGAIVAGKTGPFGPSEVEMMPGKPVPALIVGAWPSVVGCEGATVPLGAGVEPGLPGAGVEPGLPGALPAPRPSEGNVPPPPPPPQADKMHSASTPTTVATRQRRRRMNANNAAKPKSGIAARRKRPPVGATEPLFVPVVVSRMETLTGDDPTFTVGGEETHVAPCGKPTHVIVTVPLNPAVPWSVSGSVELFPALIVTPTAIDVLSVKSAVEPLFTLNGSATDDDAMFALSPVYDALIVCEPTASDDVVYEALPLGSSPVV